MEILELKTILDLKIQKNFQITGSITEVLEYRAVDIIQSKEWENKNKKRKIKRCL